MQKLNHLISWDAPEYIQHEKSLSWYIAAGIIATALIGYGIMYSNITLSLAVFAFAGVYLYLHKYSPPKITHIQISDLGVTVGKQFYPYTQIQAFWIIYTPRTQTLNLKISREFLNEISIQLGDTAPGELRQTLLQHIPELEGKTEKITDLLIQLLKL